MASTYLPPPSYEEATIVVLPPPNPDLNYSIVTINECFEELPLPAYSELDNGSSFHNSYETDSVVVKKERDDCFSTSIACCLCVVYISAIVLFSYL